MKLLIDNNLSFKLVERIQILFPGSMHVRDVLTTQADDITIWDYAKTNSFTILTKDNDFDERSQLQGCPPRIIHLVCGNKTTLDILNLLIDRQKDILSFVESDSVNCILKIS